MEGGQAQGVYIKLQIVQPTLRAHSPPAKHKDFIHQRLGTHIPRILPNLRNEAKETSGEAAREIHDNLVPSTFHSSFTDQHASSISDAPTH